MTGTQNHELTGEHLYPTTSTWGLAHLTLNWFLAWGCKDPTGCCPGQPESTLAGGSTQPHVHCTHTWGWAGHLHTTTGSAETTPAVRYKGNRPYRQQTACAGSSCWPLPAGCRAWKRVPVWPAPSWQAGVQSSSQRDHSSPQPEHPAAVSTALLLALLVHLQQESQAWGLIWVITHMPYKRQNSSGARCGGIRL